MNRLELSEVYEYVNLNIVDFHNRRIKTLEELKLSKLLNKNPYLFKAKNIFKASELIEGLLEAFLSSSEEKLFGDFLEDLAVYIANKTCGGFKSTASGVDLEFFSKDIHYVVSIKSGPNWGNSSQQRKQEENLRDAVKRIKQSRLGVNVQPVVGICYGKIRTGYLRGYLKVVGQNFWYLISENKELYTDIIEPIGYRAKEHNDLFYKGKCAIINRLTTEFSLNFCDSSGEINWKKLVEFNSCNYDLDQFIRV